MTEAIVARESESQSVKEERVELIDRGSTEGETRADRLQRCARLCSCFVADLGDGITSRVPEDKIVEREDVIM